MKVHALFSLTASPLPTTPVQTRTRDTKAVVSAGHQVAPHEAQTVAVLHVRVCVCVCVRMDRGRHAYLRGGR